MNKLVYYCLALILVLCGCKDEKKYRDSVSSNVSLEIMPSDGALKLSSFLRNDYDIIVPKGVLLANISKVLECDSFLVVKGKSADGDVHLFDKQGEYIKTILNRGGGPDEASNVWAVKIYDGDVYLLVNAGTELMRYSLAQERYLERFRLPKEVFSAADFEIMDKDNYIFYKNLPSGDSQPEYKLYAYNRQAEKIEHKWLPLHAKSSEYISFAQDDCLYRHAGNVHFYEIFQKGIYRLEKENLCGYITFQDNSYSFPDSDLFGSYTFDSFISFCEESPYIWAHRDMYEGTRFITSNFMFRNGCYWNVIDKKEKTSHSYLSVEDDLLLDTELPAKDYMYQANVQDSMRYFALPYDLLDSVVRQKKEKESIGKYTLNHPRLMQIYEGMDEGSNDLIIRFYEKQ